LELQINRRPSSRFCKSKTPIPYETQCLYLSRNDGAESLHHRPRCPQHTTLPPTPDYQATQPPCIQKTILKLPSYITYPQPFLSLHSKPRIFHPVRSQKKNPQPSPPSILTLFLKSTHSPSHSLSSTSNPSPQPHDPCIIRETTSPSQKKAVPRALLCPPRFIQLVLKGRSWS